MRTRLPVKLKLAVVTAALTFGILCLFAVVIGAVAEQRIRAGFDDDLRATAADLINRLGVRITAADQEARKRSSVSFSLDGGSPLVDARISPTRFANAWSSSSSPRPVSLLGRVVRQITPTSLPDDTIGA